MNSLFLLWSSNTARYSFQSIIGKSVVNRILFVHLNLTFLSRSEGDLFSFISFRSEFRPYAKRNSDIGQRVVSCAWYIVIWTGLEIIPNIYSFLCSALVEERRVKIKRSCSFFVSCFILLTMSTKRTCFLQDNTCTVDNDFVCLNDLSSEKIDRSRFPNASTKVEAILYRSDATNADIAKIDLKRTSLCRDHYDLLYVKFDSKKSK